MNKRSMTKPEIEKYRFHSKKYHVTGSWICSDSTVDVMFFYDGEQYCIPFKAIFDKNNVEWLMEAAIMMIESEIESVCFSALETGLSRYHSMDPMIPCVVSIVEGYVRKVNFIFPQ